MVRATATSAPTHVLVLRTLGAPPRRLLGRRRARAAAPEPGPEPVPTTRATVIEAEPSDEARAREWMESAAAGSEAPATALAVLNRALHAQRVAAATPLVHEVALEQVLVVRAGYGDGDQVADGRWTDARAMPAPGPRARGPRHSSALRPQERFAAILGGHDQPLACEELALRARADLGVERYLEAALGAEAALRAAVTELPARPGAAHLEERVTELAGLREGVATAARNALERGLSDDERDALEHALDRLAAALRARSAAGVGPS